MDDNFLQRRKGGPTSWGELLETRSAAGDWSHGGGWSSWPAEVVNSARGPWLAGVSGKEISREGEEKRGRTLKNGRKEEFQAAVEGFRRRGGNIIFEGVLRLPLGIYARSFSEGMVSFFWITGLLIFFSSPDCHSFSSSDCHSFSSPGCWFFFITGLLIHHSSNPTSQLVFYFFIHPSPHQLHIPSSATFTAIR